MTGRPGDLAQTNQGSPEAEGGGPDANSSGATASFLAELRGSGADNTAGALPEKKSKLSGPTLLVLGVAAAGVALLFAMRKFAVSGAGDFNPVKIEYTQDAAAEARAKTQKGVLDALDRSSAPLQVPTDQIKKNPFELAAKPTTVDPNAHATKTDIEGAARATAERLKKFTETLASLKLNGVMDGPTPVARINGETVRIGDTLADGLFTIVEISGRTVVIESDGKRYQLQMDSSKGQGSTPRRGK